MNTEFDASLNKNKLIYMLLTCYYIYYYQTEKAEKLVVDILYPKPNFPLFINLGENSFLLKNLSKNEIKEFRY